MTNAPIKIESAEQLDQILKDNHGVYIDFFVSLNGGLRSSKDMMFLEGRYYVTHLIDGTRQHYKRLSLLLKRTNIGEAITKKAFYQYAI